MDRRLLRSNGRVAHDSLRGRVDAERFAAGEDHMVTSPAPIDIWDAPGGKRDRQLLPGATFRVLDVETVDGVPFAFGFSKADGYVGWVGHDLIGQDAAAPTHRIACARAMGLVAQDVKQTDGAVILSLGSLVTVDNAGVQDGWVSVSIRQGQTTLPRFFRASQLLAMGSPETDPVAVAERLIHTPYLWGGNSAFGIDCSGLVQIACQACGIDCPGDSDLQKAALGTTLPAGSPYQRGDLLFWKGHVAWVAGPETLLHANAHHMAVALEPIATAIPRILAQGDGPVTRHARLL